ncbi:hypothetical protein SALBM135S_04996 [Streptomyces alboniger]
MPRNAAMFLDGEEFEGPRPRRRAQHAVAQESVRHASASARGLRGGTTAPWRRPPATTPTSVETVGAAGWLRRADREMLDDAGEHRRTHHGVRVGEVGHLGSADLLEGDGVVADGVEVAFRLVGEELRGQRRQCARYSSASRPPAAATMIRRRASGF